MIYHIEVRTDGSYWLIHCDEIPGLNLGGLNLEFLLSDFVQSWKHLHKLAPEQVPDPPQ